jgi:hypothetical protein
MNPEVRQTIAALTRLRRELAEDRRALQERASQLDEAEGRLHEPPWTSHAAVALHGWYTGLESALERTVRALDGDVPHGERWHRDLLSQATVDVPGIRPAILERDLLAELLELLAFRQFLRHAYAVPVDAGKLAQEIHRVRRIRMSVDSGLERMDAHLAATIEGLAASDS